jgi:anti-sigma B factor antagonist
VKAPDEIELERRGGALLARLVGEVDMTNAAHVRDEMLGAVPNDAHALVVDLSACTYLDSAAIEVLFDLARKLGRRRQEVRLAVPPESPLRRVLVLTEVGAAAPLFDSVEEALAQ